MIAIFVACNQAVYDDVIEVMHRHNIKGFTGWDNVTGAGSRGGEPHLGTNAWPTMNSALITFVEDEERAKRFMDALSTLDKQFEKLGLRAFSWKVDSTI